jgi:CRP-like cAMP-binding protein/uncharacterized membrane protein YdbT with pleckstrin-like domain
VVEVTLERIKQIPLMENLTEEQIGSLLPRVEELAYIPGETLFLQGEPASYLYFVERGQVSEVETLSGGQQRLHRIAGSGQYLGRYGMVTGRPFQVTATAHEETIVLAIPLRELQPILFSYPDWRGWFFRTEVAARMRAMPLFADLDDWAVYRLADHAEVLDYEADSTVHQATAKAEYLFVIDQGQVMEMPDPGHQPPGDWPRYMAAGNFFGQQPGTIAITRKKTRLYRIPWSALRELLRDRAAAPSAALVRTDVFRALQSVSLFKCIADDRLRLLAGYASLVLRRPGEIVARQGEPATALMILVEGEAIVRRQIGQEQPRPVRYFKVRRTGPNEDAQAEAGQTVYFGDHALLADELRGATVEVTETSIWIVVDRADFRRFMDEAKLPYEDLKKASKPHTAAGASLPSEPELLALPHQTRRHWIALFRGLTPAVFLIVLIAVLALAVVTLFEPTGGAEGWVIRLSLGAEVLLVLWGVWRYIDWLNDSFEVTSQAVAHIEKKLFIREERYEAPLDQIQNVNINIDVWGRLLGYGNLSIDTAAVRGQVEFTFAPEPAMIQDLVQRAAEQAKSGQRMQFRESIRQQLEDRLNPERLKPVAPGSVLVQPEPPPPAAPPPRLHSPRSWLPRFEIREADSVTWRKHWLNLLQRTGMPTVTTLLLSYLALAHIVAFVTEAFGSGRQVMWPPVSWLGFHGWLFLATLIFWTMAALWFVYQYMDWRNDVYILTQNDVIDVERDLAIYPLWFFYTESRRQASLDNVQYVDFKIPNLWAILFNYGDVIVKTAGLEGTLDFLFVSNPRRVQAEILRRLAEFRERERQQEFEERWGNMAEWFETYQDLVEQGGPGRERGVTPNKPPREDGPGRGIPGSGGSGRGTPGSRGSGRRTLGPGRPH